MAAKVPGLVSSLVSRLVSRLGSSFLLLLAPGLGGSSGSSFLAPGLAFGTVGGWPGMRCPVGLQGGGVLWDFWGVLG